MCALWSSDSLSMHVRVSLDFCAANCKFKIAARAQTVTMPRTLHQTRLLSKASLRKQVASEMPGQESPLFIPHGQSLRPVNLGHKAQIRNSTESRFYRAMPNELAMSFSASEHICITWNGLPQLNCLRWCFCASRQCTIQQPLIPWG